MSERKKEFFKYSVSNLINLPRVRRFYPLLSGKQMTVAVIDSGFDTNSLIYQKGKVVYEYDFADLDNNTYNPWDSHGNQVASIIAGNYEDFQGVAPDCDLIVAKVANDIEGYINPQALKNALQEMIRVAKLYNLVAINLSLGTTEIFQRESVFRELGIHKELDTLLDMNVAIVSAIGNQEFTQGVSYPAAHPRVIGVGSLNSFSELTDVSDFSQFHPDSKLVECYVESNPILTNVDNLNFKLEIGTSFAAPIVTGFLALAQQMAYDRYSKYIPIRTLRNLLVSSCEIFYEVNYPDHKIISNLDPLYATMVQARTPGKRQLQFFARRFDPLNFLYEVENYLNVWASS